MDEILGVDLQGGGSPTIRQLKRTGVRKNMDKILIIEDSRAQAEYLKSILSDDYEVTICLEAMSTMQTEKVSPSRMASRHFKLLSSS